MALTLVATGGTIASTKGDDGMVTATLTGADLMAGLPGGTGVHVVDLPVPGSWNMSAAHARDIVGAVLDALRGGSEGVVITHGTDVLEETAFLTELLARPATVHGPVVFTAAMRDASQFGGDGPRNLLDALTVAADPAASGRGALVCLNGEIHHARWVVKSHATALCSFESPGRARVGTVEGSEVDFVLPSPPPPPEPPAEPCLESRIPIVVSHWDSDEELIPWHLSRGAEGIVIQAGGAGNVNAGLLRGVRAALEAGVPVVVSTRCRSGAVAPVYGGAGGFATIADSGAISAGSLPAGKARLALMVALELDRSPDAVAGYFSELHDRP
jgi:L-asparaginase